MKTPRFLVFVSLQIVPKLRELFYKLSKSCNFGLRWSHDYRPCVKTNARTAMPNLHLNYTLPPDFAGRIGLTSLDDRRSQGAQSTTILSCWQLGHQSCRPSTQRTLVPCVQAVVSRQFGFFYSPPATTADSNFPVSTCCFCRFSGLLALTNHHRRVLISHKGAIPGSPDSMPANALGPIRQSVLENSVNST